MYPILFEAGSLTVYSYGFMIAVGIVAGMGYLVIEGKKETGLTFDQANALFLIIFFAALVGGKLFLFLEAPSEYLEDPSALFSGSGFVFYGSFLLTVPAMWWFFRKHRLPVLGMLDVMAITTCIVHLFGGMGCFLAGCCFGRPTHAAWGVTFTDPACYAQPLNTPLFPTQLFEAGYIFIVMIALLVLKKRRAFYGQMFLLYLILYAIGRFVLEYFRGDVERGFIIENYLSHSQFIALCVIMAVVLIYLRMKRLSLKPLKGT